MPLCTNNFRNSPGLAFYRIPKTRHIQQEYVRLPQKANLKLTAGFSRGKITPGTSSSFSIFFLSNPPSVFLFWAVLTPLKHSTLLSAMFVFICDPPNHPINARLLSLGPRLSLFSEGSYLRTETFLYDLSCSFDVTFSAIYPDTAMPTFSLPLMSVLKRQSSHNSIVWRFKTIPQTVVNCECLTSETTTTPKSKIVASVETTEEVDYTMDESNEKDTVEEDVYLTVFPRYALNYLLNLTLYLFD